MQMDLVVIKKVITVILVQINWQEDFDIITIELEMTTIGLEIFVLLLLILLNLKKDYRFEVIIDLVIS